MRANPIKVVILQPHAMKLCEWCSILARTLTYGGVSSLLVSTPSPNCEYECVALIAQICFYCPFALGLGFKLGFKLRLCASRVLSWLAALQALTCADSHVYPPRALLIVRFPVSTISTRTNSIAAAQPRVAQPLFGQANRLQIAKSPRHCHQMQQRSQLQIRADILTGP